MKKIAAFLIFSLFLLVLPFKAETGDEVEIIVKTYNSDAASIYGLYAIDTSYEIVYTFDNIMNGYVIKTDSGNLDAIKALDFVEDACISETITIPEIHESFASSSVGADIVSSVAGLDGEGTVVAVIDSELDVNHEAFSITNPDSVKLKKTDIAEIMTNNTLNITGVTANRVYRNPKIPFAYDYCEKDTDVWDENNIHGTHVAGIVAGNSDEVRGIAPEAQIIFMKVFRTIAGTALGTTADVFAAVEDAVNFNVSSINLSLGVDYALAESSSYSMFRDIIETVKNKGIVISCSSGNLGRGYANDPVLCENTDYGITSIPSGFSETLSVGSVNNPIYTAYTLTVGEETVVINEGDSTTSFSKAFSSKEYEYSYVSYGTAAKDYLPSKGKIALIEAYTPNNLGISIASKITAAKNAGAIGAVIISKNNSYSTLPKTDIPACVVSKKDGEILKSADSPILKANNSLTEIKQNGIEISDFSAYNYTTDLTLSVDITAPGGMIYSSVPNDLYKSFSGTSMSAPQIAGAAALMDSYISKKFPDITGRDKANLSERIMMSTAKPVTNEEGNSASPMVQGAGLLDLTAAVSSNAVLYGETGKTKISLGANLTDSFALSFIKENLNSLSDGYDTVKVEVLSDGSYEQNGKNYIGGVIPFSFSHTVNTEFVSESQTKYTIDVTLDSSDVEKQSEIYKNGFFLFGYVFLSSSDGSEVPLSIPFMGYYGDFRKPPVFDESGDVYYAKYPNSYVLINDQRVMEPIGTNIFDGSFHPDKRTISPNGDGYNDTIYIYPRFLRNINYLYLMLMRSEYDSASQVIKSGISKFTGNSYYNIPITDRFTGEIIEDGSYYIKLTATLSYNTGTMKTVTYPIVADTEPPKFLSVDREENADGVFATLKLSDNHYLQAVVMEATDTSGNKITVTEIPDAIEPASETTVKFDLKNIDESTIKFSVYDYGFNKKTAIRLNSSEYSEISSGANIGFAVDSETASDIYFAQFSDGILNNIRVFSSPVLPLCENEVFSITENNISLKLIFWEKNTMKPQKLPFAFILI